MVEAVKEQGLTTIVTPFDENSVSRCLDHGIQIIKIASCSATDWPLLEKIAEARRPVILSTGGLSIYQIDNIVSFFSHRNVELALMHCVALYPAPNENLQMGFLEKMSRRYSYVPVGYSGHEDPDNLDAVKIAISKGARLLERHVGYPTDKIKLNKYSMNPEQVAKWVEAALEAKKMCQGYERHVTQTEIDSLLSLKRGVYAKKDIRKGKVIRKEDVFFAMPCADGQTNSGEFGEYRSTLVASKNYKKNEPVSERKKPDLISSVRGIVHDAKGMIYEARIEFGDDFEVELSHHYGIEHFRQTGALIVNIINREYCKKLVVVLPGQKHPNHRHKIKEETFQLLWGDMEVVLNDRKLSLKPGDKVLVERGAWHSFSSRNGAIFEEVSTTHVKGDSYYEDPKISSLDPMDRKTLLESW